MKRRIGGSATLRPSPGAMGMSTLVLLRHGQSLWNLENRFTGWTDVPLTEAGRDGARKSALLLADLHFDVAYTSQLSRARETLEIVLAEIGQSPPTIPDAALNERHYGELQGLDKAETARRVGADLLYAWRRSWDVTPPGGESLAETAQRALPFFERAIREDLRRGKNVLVVAHGNSLRAIVMMLDGLGPRAIEDVEIGFDTSIVYEIDRAGAVHSKHVRPAPE